ncbi:putative DNA topoisomerase (ATP-hydrolyzing) [Rosa chinensis]|uniref:Putative DNA topoisomerase (ATP-hydrolyzing) n=2 Tax=Rosa chinensis TaxID=74649 RepID=A0A2P6SJD6_ROSCH|nr:putative DNA topoisomerase (ATP-hydrolyzing) [Rosa chinensis]
MKMNCRTSRVTIPHDLNMVSEINSDALFILLIDQSSNAYILERELARFAERFPRIIVFINQVHGQPANTTGLFLMEMKMKFPNMPMLALVNASPEGVKMLLSLEGLDVKWLGIRTDDFAKYKIPTNVDTPLTEVDIKLARHLLEEERVQKNPVLRDDLNHMVATESTVESDAVLALGAPFLYQVYLPLKLQYMDWQ